MPTYEYSCKSCGEHLEVVQSFKDGPLTECPNCGGLLRKVFGNIGIVFKGSGFYRNDSRSSQSGSKPVAASSGSESTATAGAEPAKTDGADAKPAKKETAATTGSSASPAPPAQSAPAAAAS